MYDILEWSGWQLQEIKPKGTRPVKQKLIAPRQAWLTPAEARILRALMTWRIEQCEIGQSQKITTIKHISPEELRARSASPTISTLRTVIATLRDAIGKEAIQSDRDLGYILLPANSRFHTDPIDDLVKALTDALAAAKRIQENDKQEKLNQ